MTWRDIIFFQLWITITDRRLGLLRQLYVLPWYRRIQIKRIIIPTWIRKHSMTSFTTEIAKKPNIQAWDLWSSLLVPHILRLRKWGLSIRMHWTKVFNCILIVCGVYAELSQAELHYTRVVSYCPFVLAVHLCITFRFAIFVIAPVCALSRPQLFNFLSVWLNADSLWKHASEWLHIVKLKSSSWAYENFRKKPRWNMEAIVSKFEICNGTLGSWFSSISPATCPSFLLSYHQLLPS